MINIFLLAARQLLDPAFRVVILRAVMMSTFVFICLFVIIWIALSETSFFNFWLFETIADVLGGIAVITLTWLFFPVLATFFIGLYLDDIVDAVEGRHYPESFPSKPIKFSAILTVSFRFTVTALFLNILALPIYFLTIWFPPLAIFFFYCLNGYLLGREYFELVALRHVNATEIAALQKTCGWRIFPAGIGIAFLFTVPFVNFFAPILGVAAITHLFKQLTTAKRE